MNDNHATYEHLLVEAWRAREDAARVQSPTARRTLELISRAYERLARLVHQSQPGLPEASSRSQNRLAKAP